MIASPLSIVHQTSGLLFIDKPPGLSFHASAEGDPGVLPLLREQIDDERLYSVHRLDRVHARPADDRTVSGGGERRWIIAAGASHSQILRRTLSTEAKEKDGINCWRHGAEPPRLVEIAALDGASGGNKLHYAVRRRWQRRCRTARILIETAHRPHASAASGNEGAWLTYSRRRPLRGSGRCCAGGARVPPCIGIEDTRRTRSAE